MTALTCAQIQTAAAEYLESGYTVAEYIHDQFYTCDCCKGVFADMSDFDAAVFEHDGVFVCEDCSPSYVEDVITSRTMIREHGTFAI